MHPHLLEEWIKDPNKKSIGWLIIWKTVVASYHIIGKHLMWNIGNGQARISTDAR